MKHNNFSCYGFTLVELAIVLMIIGLLIGGILKGQELIENARLSTVMRQKKSYEAAMITFQDSYGAIPGDFATAMTRLANCTVGNNCQNGDGNSLIGPTQVSAYYTTGSTIAGENAQFWKHLALANLISGVSGAASTIEFGQSYPVASTGGGFFATNGTRVTDADTIGGAKNYLVLRGLVSGLPCWDVSTTSTDCALSPRQASQMDRKMDDGAAMTGDVVSISAAYGNGCGYGGYNGYTNASTKTCDIVFGF
jgi:prepilin-type N-terminal cleavage/methylation domain-containing protein